MSLGFRVKAVRDLVQEDYVEIILMCGDVEYAETECLRAPSVAPSKWSSKLDRSGIVAKLGQTGAIVPLFRAFEELAQNLGNLTLPRKVRNFIDLGLESDR